MIETSVTTPRLQAWSSDECTGARKADSTFESSVKALGALEDDVCKVTVHATANVNISRCTTMGPLLAPSAQRSLWIPTVRPQGARGFHNERHWYDSNVSSCARRY